MERLDVMASIEAVPPTAMLRVPYCHITIITATVTHAVVFIVISALTVYLVAIAASCAPFQSSPGNAVAPTALIADAVPPLRA